MNIKLYRKNSKTIENNYYFQILYIKDRYQIYNIKNYEDDNYKKRRKL